MENTWIAEMLVLLTMIWTSPHVSYAWSDEDDDDEVRAVVNHLRKLLFVSRCEGVCRSSIYIYILSNICFESYTDSTIKTTYWMMCSASKHFMYQVGFIFMFDQHRMSE